MPEASVIIRARNEEALIGRALAMVAAQTLRDLEIVVVDSGSTDRTLEIARGFTPLIAQIAPAEFSYGHALNVGCRHSSGQYGVLLSAHAIPIDEHWLDRLLDPFAEEDVAATWGSEHGWFDTVETLPSSLSTKMSLSQENFGPHNGVWGFNASNAAIRLELWRNTPFDEYLPASEDKLWAWKHIKNGYKVVYIPEASVHHTHQLSLQQVYHRARQEHWAVAQFMPDLEFGLLDVARGILKRPRRGLWKEAGIGGQRWDIFHSAGHLGYRLARRLMYYWGLYQGLKDGRLDRARRPIEQTRDNL